MLQVGFVISRSCTKRTAHEISNQAIRVASPDRANRLFFYERAPAVVLRSKVHCQEDLSFRSGFEYVFVRGNQNMQRRLPSPQQTGKAGGTERVFRKSRRRANA